MKRARIGVLLVVAAYTIQAAWYALLMVSYVSSRGVLEGADFVFYYAAGRVAREYGLVAVYNLDLEAEAQVAVTGRPPGSQQVFLPNHPPFLYPVMMLLSGLEYRPAYLCFAAILLLLVVPGLLVLRRTLMSLGWSRAQARLLLAGILFFEPFFISILKGQDSALLLLGGLLWLAGFLDSDDRLAGLGLALTLVRPQVALVLALPFLFRRRKILAWFCLGAAALGLYSYLQVGWGGAVDYYHLLTLSAAGQGYGIAEAAMFNLVGALLRLVPGLDPQAVHAIGWGVYAASLLGLCLLWGFSKQVQLWHLALAVTLSLFAAPHLHYHDLALLAVPLVGLAAAGVAAGRLPVRRAALLPLLASIVLLFAGFWAPVRFSVPYIVMLALPLATWRWGHVATA
jgi:hypothetical protein